MSRYSTLLGISSLALIAGGYFLATRGKQRKFEFTKMRRKMMERMINMMPEGSPPKVILSVVPHLQEQNEEILTLLKEQNELLRQMKRND